jgi:hypothetical protein
VAVFSHIVSLDLEVGKRDQRIHRLAAVPARSGESYVFGGGDQSRAVVELDPFWEFRATLLERANAEDGRTAARLLAQHHRARLMMR